MHSPASWLGYEELSTGLRVLMTLVKNLALSTPGAGQTLSDYRGPTEPGALWADRGSGSSA